MGGRLDVEDRLVKKLQPNRTAASNGTDLRVLKWAADAYNPGPVARAFWGGE